ncbi:hypothetical protein GGS21DRAFT_534587 [Xylaria nigripes]|nr:hypothetical protein GGS21DRAFT_534587 [Xylaria nigripes]
MQLTKLCSKARIPWLGLTATSFLISLWNIWLQVSRGQGIRGWRCPKCKLRLEIGVTERELVVPISSTPCIAYSLCRIAVPSLSETGLTMKNSLHIRERPSSW